MNAPTSLIVPCSALLALINSRYVSSVTVAFVSFSVNSSHEKERFFHEVDFALLAVAILKTIFRKSII